MMTYDSPAFEKTYWGFEELPKHPHTTLAMTIYVFGTMDNGNSIWVVVNGAWFEWRWGTPDEDDKDDGRHTVSKGEEKNSDGLHYHVKNFNFTWTHTL